jgi:hypothetical protein
VTTPRVFCRAVFCRALIASFAGSLIWAAAASAATINVDSNADPTAAATDCTLNQAIVSANTNAAVAGSGCEVGELSTTAVDNIVIPASIGPTITLNGALPNLGGAPSNESVEVSGPGRDQLTVQRSGSAGPFRIFFVEANDVSISGMTVSNGLVTGAGDQFGGGVFSQQEGLLLEDFAATGNKVTASGTGAPQGAQGGGILSQGEGTLLRDVVVSGNTVTATTPAATPCCETVQAHGAGLDLADYLTLENVTVKDNTATAGGDGVKNATVLGAGLYHNINGLTVEGSTITGNTGTATAKGDTAGTNSAQALGGGVYMNSGTESDLERSTIEGNSVSTSALTGDAVNARGGGVYVTTFVNPVLTALTLTGNTSATGANLYVNFPGAELGNTIISNPQGGGSNCAGLPLTSDGYNLEDAMTCGFTGTGDQQNANPLLGPLASNGGPTQTMALQSGSPAIDKGSALGLMTDQRGVARPFDFPSIAPAAGGDNSDIGAFELQDLLQDLIAPNTFIGKVKIKRAARKATFNFSSSEPGSTFLCKLDKKPFKPCSSPKKYKHLRHRKHKFQVQAKDAAGNRDGSPAIKKFKI